MISKVVAVKSEEVLPDILIPYNVQAKALGDSSLAVLSVRPETNQVKYEAVIIKTIEPYADVVYLASLSGMLLNKKAIVASHYSSQFHFAINGKVELERYPEMVEKFEQKFNVGFKNAKIIGSYEAILDYKIKKNADSLFHTMVPESDFLEMYGHTIKKINGYYVLNYDIPAVITAHNRESAVFIIAVRFKESQYRMAGIHHLIYENMRRNKSVTFLDSEKRQNMPWYDRVRRTYHISRSHIEAMFDLTDYVFKDEKHRICFADTPLGQKLLHQRVFDEKQLEVKMAALKENPMVYLREADGSSRLANIICAGKTKKGSTFIEKDLDQCVDIIRCIQWNRIKQG
jgi:hypothetical protein